MAEETDERRVVQASEIMAKIKEGEPIKYDNVVIRGYLDISELNLLKNNNKFIVSSLIMIRNSYFIGTVRFDNTIFKNSVDFFGTEFHGDHEFFGCASFTGSQFHRFASFNFVKFEDTVSFDGSEFSGTADFMMSEFKGPASFSESQFNADVTFMGSRFHNPDADFSASLFSKRAFFAGCKFNGVDFRKTTFVEDVDFGDSKFSRGSTFGGAKFRGKADLDEAKFIGDVLTLRDAKFNDPKSQEDACRRAKNVLEKNGNREEAGYHFYREMEARRKQKPGYIRYPEFLFIQMIFGYGVHPEWLMYWWILIIAIFAFIYAFGDALYGATGPFDYIKVSFAIAIAPGYIAAIINPGSTGYSLALGYQALAMAETIVGTFLWAGFIATFAKKYMR